MSTFLKDKALRYAIGAFLVARIAYSVWALVIVQLNPLLVSNLNLFGSPVVAVFDLTTSTRAVYSRRIDGRELHLRATPPYMTDWETGSTWNLNGIAVAGTLTGSALTPSTFTTEDVYPYRDVTAETALLLAPWQRFDVNWYLAIAERGYGTIPGDTHFPPLYPALIRAIGTIVGDDYVAALLISNMALIGVLALLYRTLAERYGESVARRTGAFMLIFPTAFFFFSAYTEGLFLLAALYSLLALEREQWLRAGVAVFCAILVRLQGVALLVPFVYCLWVTRTSGRNWARIAGAIIALSAGGVYLGLRYLAGESAVLPTTEPNLFARLAPPWENFVYAIQTVSSGSFHTADVLNLVATTLFVVLLILGWKRLPMTFSLYAVASLVILTMRLVDTQPLNSMGRYVLTLFPVFALLGMWGSKNPWIQRAIVYLSFALALFFSAQFFMWGWVG